MGVTRRLDSSLIRFPLILFIRAGDGGNPSPLFPQEYPGLLAP